MGSRTYDPEEIEEAAGEIVPSPDPEVAFFLGPTSESDQIHAFAHKLDALLFLRGYYGDQLNPQEIQTVQSQIDRIRQDLSDGNTPPVADLFGESESFEVYADGYWDEFVVASQPYWDEWIEEAGEPLLQPQFMDDFEDEEENPDKIDEEDDSDRGGSFLYVEPPEDVYNIEFMDAMMRIMPVA